jgi:hypothetical protein
MFLTDLVNRESSDRGEVTTGRCCAAGPYPAGDTLYIPVVTATATKIIIVPRMSAIAPTSEARSPLSLVQRTKAPNNPRCAFFFRAMVVPRGDDNDNEVFTVAFLFLPMPSHRLRNIVVYFSIFSESILINGTVVAVGMDKEKFYDNFSADKK